MSTSRFVKVGIAGYGPDLDVEDTPLHNIREVCESIRYELDACIDMLVDGAHGEAALGDYEAAWKMHELSLELQSLAANLDYDKRAMAPLYRDNPDHLAATMELILDEKFPLDVTLDGSRRLYVWEADAEADFEEVAERQGWTQDTMLGVVMDFVGTRGYKEALNEYARDRAAEENNL